MIPRSPTMAVPLRTDDDGVIRVGNTRVLLELVIHAYYMGETPEGIVDSYPSLTAAEVYAVIGYYLANRDEIDTYVRERDAKVDTILHEMEATIFQCHRGLVDRRYSQRTTRVEKPHYISAALSSVRPRYSSLSSSIDSGTDSPISAATSASASMLPRMVSVIGSPLFIGGDGSSSATSKSPNKLGPPSQMHVSL